VSDVIVVVWQATGDVVTAERERERENARHHSAFCKSDGKVQRASDTAANTVHWWTVHHRSLPASTVLCR